mgnify:FL=1|tara:strand:+ start:1426 stop:1779 length:354 start_codon:yes stop_codon:yes gene_type:complete
MPILIEAHRYLTETLAGKINQMVFGFDGSSSTSDDGGAGRPSVVVTPSVQVLDEHTISVEGKLDTTVAFTTPIREVVLQYKNPSDSTDILPIFRYTVQPVTKNSGNELKFSILVEVR